MPTRNARLNASRITSRGDQCPLFALQVAAPDVFKSANCQNLGGLTLQSGAKFVSEGTPLSPNRLLKYCNVQEQPIFWGASTNSLKMFILVVNPAVLQEVRLRFTQMPFLAVPGFQQQVLDGGLGLLAVTDCQLQGAWLNFSPSGSIPMKARFTNNLMDRTQFRASQYSLSVTPCTLYLRDNLLIGGLKTCQSSLLTLTRLFWHSWAYAAQAASRV